MSFPPQPGAWQPPGAHGQPPQAPPPGHQQPWYPPPGPPRKGGPNWTILGITALVVVAIVTVAIVVVLHSDSGGNSKGSTTSTAVSASDIASANDTAPVTVITDDPSCAPWTPIINTLAASQQNGWDKRDPSIPASAWSTDQRGQFDAVGTAMRHAADETVALAKLTPHRVMRELYEQSIAYWRAYADSIADYTANDEHLALVTTAAASAIGAICNGITYGSAATRGPLVAAPAAPTQSAPSGDPAKPPRFLSASNQVCSDWLADLSQDAAATAEWQKTDSNIPASQWSPEQKALNDAVGPVMTSFYDKFEQLGRRSDNPTLEDFAVLSAQYGRAYVQGIATYVPADQYLNQAASYSNGVVRQACQAVGS